MTSSTSASWPSTAGSVAFGASCRVLEAARRGVRHIVVPLENVAEAQLVDGVVVHGAGSLADVVRWYTAAAERGEPLPPAATRER